MIGRLLHRAFRANETAVHELNYLFWECTTRCNLHCRHCGSDCFAASRDVDMPLEDFLRAFDTIPREERANPFTVVLTGGEPLLRPDIAEVGRALRRRHVSWGIVSNGWFYDEAMHRKLMDAGMGTLTISLDGLAEAHDWMRGRPGSFERAERAIALAAAEGPRLHFDVVTCVNRRNFQELEALYGRLQALGVPQWRIFTIIPIGRAAQDPDMHLTDAEFTALMDFIAAKRAEIPGQARNDGNRRQRRGAFGRIPKARKDLARCRRDRGGGWRCGPDTLRRYSRSGGPGPRGPSGGPGVGRPGPSPGRRSHPPGGRAGRRARPACTAGRRNPSSPG